jgi:hypothetical protein
MGEGGHAWLEEKGVSPKGGFGRDNIRQISNRWVSPKLTGIPQGRSPCSTQPTSGRSPGSSPVNHGGFRNDNKERAFVRAWKNSRSVTESYGGIPIGYYSKKISLKFERNWGLPSTSSKVLHRKIASSLEDHQALAMTIY